MKPHPSPQRVLTLLGAGTAISLLGDATLYAVLPNPPIAAQAGVTMAMVGVLLGVNRGTRLLLNGPVGVLYDRLPRRRLLITSLVLGVISSIMYAAGWGFWPWLAGRVVWGVAWSLLSIGCNAVVLDISTDENRGRHSGQYQMWFFVGVAFSSFLGGLFTDVFGFRPGLWLDAALIGGAALLWLFFLPETRPAQPRERPASNPRPSFSWRILLAVALPIFAVRFLSWGVLAATTILWLAGLFGEGVRLSNRLIPIATLTGSFIALSTITSISSAPIAGFLSDRLSRRWPVVAGAVLLGGAGVWLMSAKLPALALIGGFVAPVMGGSVETLVPAVVGDRFGRAQRGRALGLVYTLADLGSTLGPPLALGLLNAGWVSLGRIYQGGAIILVGVALFALLQVRREGPPLVNPTSG
ncbi:MAG: MFS transporter [Anaerolineales bacterium]|nr:MAG: MFS transporter [Anaerolineales bacterium]